MPGHALVIAIVGGTGKLGAALARGWSRAGYSVVIGSRDARRAAAAASALAAETGGTVTGMDNLGAATAGDIVVVTVPFAHQRRILEEIRPVVGGKIVVDTTVPLMPPKVARVQLPAEDSAAVAGQAILGAEVTVVSAFHNVAAHKLAAGSADCDVLVFGDSKVARAQVVSLVEALGLRGLHGGVLANSTAAEALTSVLVFINRLYQADGAGLRIVGELTPPKDA
ncbi:MAG TPA: NADPH-dependent F420 reductase [Kiloniellales bacterium]